jgi:hypothetical protein
MAAVVTAGGALRSRVGRRGRLRLIRLSYPGFEKVEMLVPVALLEGGELLSTDEARALLRSPMRDPGALPAIALEDADMQDAADQALFEIQSAVDVEEQKRFERASEQAERFIEDRLLVRRRRRKTLLERIEQARQRRDGAAGSEARTDAESSLLRLSTELEELDAAIACLENRDDATYQRYVEHIQRRRYAPPAVDRLFDLDLVIE